MFADAFKLASGYTRPLVLSVLDHNGSTGNSVGAFVPLNRDGWVMTAFHAVKGIQDAGKSREAWLQKKKEIESVEADPTLNSKQRGKKLKRVRPSRDERFIAEFAIFWGFAESRFVEAVILEEADLAIAKIQPFDPDWIGSFPKIKDPSKPMDPGTSLCTMGYPFYQLDTTYDPQSGFSMASAPTLLFPIDGILTRQVLISEAKKEGDPPVAFIESSNPGLQGQSGGPVVDRKGTVWGLQVRTHHLDLGFTVKKQGSEREEHQFLNCGLAVHPETIVRTLEAHDIAYELAEY